MRATTSLWVGVDPSRVFVKGLKVVLSLLMGVILMALATGVMRTLWDMAFFWTDDLEVAVRRVIINALILLALVEVFRTLLAYFTEGRVKVTFIVDTVLVVMLTEMISLWFKGGTWNTIGSMVFLLITLSVMRIMAVRYSPTLTAKRSGDVSINT